MQNSQNNQKTEETQNYKIKYKIERVGTVIAGNIIIFKGAELGIVPSSLISDEERELTIELSRPLHNSMRNISREHLVKYPDGERNCPSCGQCFYPQNYDDYDEVCYGCQVNERTHKPDVPKSDQEFISLLHNAMWQFQCQGHGFKHKAIESLKNALAILEKE